MPEDDPAEEALQFALKFELLTKEEAKKLKLRTIDDFADPDSFGIPRCPHRSCTVVVHFFICCV